MTDDSYVLEREGNADPQILTLNGEQFTIGKRADNDLSLPHDHTVSRAHAILAHYPGGWSVRDLASRNGTYINGERICRERTLRPNDQITIGATRLTYRLVPPDADHTLAGPHNAAPPLTRREREVLAHLCLPVVHGKPFTSPASDPQIADELHIGKDAVRQHLLHLYDKFGINADAKDGEKRRFRLANQALSRDAITMAELHALSQKHRTR